MGKKGKKKKSSKKVKNKKGFGYERYAFDMEYEHPMISAALKLGNIGIALEEKHGDLPEEVDKKCLSLMGMRFKEYTSTILEMGVRDQAENSGAIPSLMCYLPIVGYEIDGEEKTWNVSPEEYAVFTNRVGKLTTENTPEEHLKKGIELMEYLNTLT